jgi:hypothetical protein
MDESGISKDEPIVVVSGVVVHGDDQIVPLEEHLAELVEKHIPHPDRDGFVFEAKHIWSGGGYFKNKDAWTPELRFAILDDLAAIPSKLDIPVLYGYTDKLSAQAQHPSGSSWTARELAVNTHAVAFLECTLNVEDHMRLVWPDEISQLVAEDNTDARVAIKGSYALLRNPTSEMRKSELVPLQKIKGPVLFADKAESRPLQLADTCAFLIKRRLQKDDEKIQRFYSKLLPMMLPSRQQSRDFVPLRASLFDLGWATFSTPQTPFRSHQRQERERPAHAGSSLIRRNISFTSLSRSLPG